ncbi:uncharacterized protein LOC126162788 [Schistocerca cancellata]|uniref:uncharacterized protein LOC126162788 n=1 Tax=Schistocerca cancellata TaxID=274614 RepID=UPI0021174796|nr:uncharacterized protein LOC126162788 [Schistocerca cancellata]
MQRAEASSSTRWRSSAADTIRQLEQIWPTLTWPAKRLPVLDVGCGPEDIVAKFLAPRVPEGTKIIACDACPEKLEHAKGRNSVPDVIIHDLFDVTGKDLQNTSVWKQGPYCKVFSLMQQLWLPENRRAIQNIHKLLAPGGEAIFTVVPKFSLWGGFEDTIDDPEWRQHMKDVQRTLSPYGDYEDPVSELKKLLITEGFQISHCAPGAMEVDFRSRKEVRELLISLNALLNSILEDLANNTFNCTCELNGTGEEQDGYSGESTTILPCSCMIVVGKKL